MAGERDLTKAAPLKSGIDEKEEKDGIKQSRTLADPDVVGWSGRSHPGRAEQRVHDAVGSARPGCRGAPFSKRECGMLAQDSETVPPSACGRRSRGPILTLED